MCFFFKQKTAYEMRISDWSSDVCSSDLALSRAPRTPIYTPQSGKISIARPYRSIRKLEAPVAEYATKNMKAARAKVNAAQIAAALQENDLSDTRLSDIRRPSHSSPKTYTAHPSAGGTRSKRTNTLSPLLDIETTSCRETVSQ